MPGASRHHLYAIAVGSNRRHARHGPPSGVVAAAVREMGKRLGAVVALSSTVHGPPLGPSRRRYANAAALLETPRGPRALLADLQAMERAFGRRKGRRWGQRVLDLDIILWSGGTHVDAELRIPHPAWRQRDFVVAPLAQIAPDWRDPVTNLAVRHFAARLRRFRAVDPRNRNP